MRRALLLAAILLAVPVWAGDATDPELTDPAGDQQETEPGTGDGVPGLGQDHEFPDTDILAAWIEELNATHVRITAQVNGDLLDNTVVVTSFQISPGPTSVFESTAANQTVTFEAQGDAVLAGAASATRNGATMAFTFARADVGASGGDLLSELAVSTSRSEEAGCEVLCTAQTGSDTAQGGRAFALSRPDPVPGAGLVVDNAHLVLNGTSTPFTAAIETEHRNATGQVVFVLTNLGTDVDTFHYEILAPELLETAGINATLSNHNGTLDPGASLDFAVNLTLQDTEFGDHGIVVQVASARGASTVAGSLITILEPAAPEPEPEPEPTPTAAPEPEPAAGRDPLVGGGTFLQDAAEGTGFDKAFDDAAELVFLALALLVLILLLFLIFLLAGARWVKVTLTPRRQTVAPGETAEFQVRVRNRKHRFHDALAYFDGDASWKTGVLLQGQTAPAPLTRTGEEVPFGLPAKEDDDLEGTLRVQAPVDAEDGAEDDVTLNVVPVEAGHRQARRAGRARVTVRTEDSAKPRIRMADVRHEPHDPAPGEQVTTTALIENDGDTARLRVVLQLDGRDLEEETVEVPAGGARAVLFPWRAGAGSNRVRVQVFEA